MRLLLGTLAVLTIAAATAMGWRTAAPPPEPLGLSRGKAAAAQASADPIGRTRAAATLVEAGLFGASAPPNAAGDPEAAAPQPQPPAEPDLAGAFRRQLSAVVAERPGGPYYALLAGEGGRQVLRPGAVFQNRWTLARLSLDQAEFTRGRERRVVPLFDASGGAPAPAPAAPAGAASSPTDGVSSPPLD